MKPKFRKYQGVHNDSDERDEELIWNTYPIENVRPNVTRKQLEEWAKKIDEDGCWSKKAVITDLCELLGIK